MARRSREIHQRVYRLRAAAAKKSVLIAVRELRRAFNEIRGMADGPTPDLDEAQAMAEGAITDAGADIGPAIARARAEEAAARQRMLLKVVGSVGVAVVATHMVRNHRRKSRERSDPRDDRRDPVDERRGGRPPVRRPLEAPADDVDLRRRHRTPRHRTLE